MVTLMNTKLKVAIINFLLIINSSLMAKVKSQVKHKNIIKNEDLNSRQNRQELKYQLIVGSENKTNTVGPANFFEIGYFFSSQQMLNLKYVTYKGTYNSPLSKHQQLEFLGKIFSGNSFYTKLGAFYRKGDYRPSSYYYPYDGSEYIPYYEYGVKLSIGNQWQWKSLTIGSDWIGIDRNIKSNRYDFNANTERSSRNKDTSNNEIKVNLLSLYIGASF